MKSSAKITTENIMNRANYGYSQVRNSIRETTETNCLQTVTYLLLTLIFVTLPPALFNTMIILIP